MLNSKTKLQQIRIKRDAKSHERNRPVNSYGERGKEDRIQWFLTASNKKQFNLTVEKSKQRIIFKH